MRAVQIAPDRWNFQYEGGGYVTPLTARGETLLFFTFDLAK